ncbi:hypothetical protein [uncultured Gammaproteobacteria bacterium]|nr:hypothetical protein [uncultured Gammaproteobacteria bacterium]
MRIIKVIMVIALLILAVSVFLYMNNTDNTNTNTNTNTSTGDTSPQVDKDKEISKKINQEHKINQDDKDSVVESNRLLLNKLHSLESKLKDLKDNQKQQDLAIQESNKNMIENNKTSSTQEVVSKVMSLLNLKDKSSDKRYKVNKIKNADSAIQTQVKYTWTKALQSGVLDEEGNFVHIPELSRQDLNDDKGIVSDPVDNDEVTLRPVYTIPNNSILSGKLITGLIGRIPLDGQLTDPFRFSIKIIKKSFYANRHVNNVLQDVIASGTASGDLRLSCVRASIDSITFIFEDGTISDHKISDIGFITNEYGLPCIEGELITDAAQYLMTTSLLSGLSSAAKAVSEAQKTLTSNNNGSSSSSLTGSPSKLSAYSALSGGVDDAKDWFNQRTKSSFDVIFVPSGKSVKILTQEQINIDYDPNGRKLDHQLATGEWNNEILD